MASPRRSGGVPTGSIKIWLFIILRTFQQIERAIALENTIGLHWGSFKVPLNEDHATNHLLVPSHPLCFLGFLSFSGDLQLTQKVKHVAGDLRTAQVTSQFPCRSACPRVDSSEVLEHCMNSHGYGSKCFATGNWTAGFSPWFNLPGFRFGYLFFMAMNLNREPPWKVAGG